MCPRPSADVRSKCGYTAVVDWQVVLSMQPAADKQASYVVCVLKIGWISCP